MLKSISPVQDRVKANVIYRFADVEIDTSRQELRRDGASIHIEPQVFDVIVHLVRNRDRVVSKDDLIEAIWDRRAISAAALNSRINAARRSLGDNGNDQIFIKTLNKRGFRFVGEVEEMSAGSEDQDVRLVPEAGLARSPAGGSQIPPTISQRNVASDSTNVTSATQSSIAVVPFGNMSGDTENDYFSYGLTEDIIRLLARSRWLAVISRHSTMAFRERPVDPREVGRQLAVTYLVLGSVRKHRDAVNIAAELVRTSDGRQLWSESYNFRVDSVFDIQEEMATQITATIEPELSKIEQKLSGRKTPNSLNAWDCYQRGLWNLWRFTQPAFDEAEAYFERAIEADPKFARSHAALSYVNVQRAFLDDPASRPARLITALRQARVSVALDDYDCFCQCVLGRALCLTHRNDEAIAALDLSMGLNPSFAQAYFAQGFNLLWYGREIEAEVLLDRATTLSPRDNHLWSFHLARSWVHFSLEEYEFAAEFARRATWQSNAGHQAFATLAASLGIMGERRQAKEVAAQLLQRRPRYSAKTARHEFFFCNKADFVERYIKGLRSADLPE
jgi:TolB-like protein